MPATVTTEKIAVNLLLNNGTTQTGSVKTATVGMGTINKDTFDVDKALAIAELIAQCLAKSVYKVRKVQYDEIN